MTTTLTDAREIPPSFGPLLDLLECSEALIAIFDPDDVLRFANARFRAAYFIEEGEVLTYENFMYRNFENRRGSVARTDDFASWLTSMQSTRGKDQTLCFERELHDGRVLWITETLVKGWILCVATEVTELNRSERSLRMTRDRFMRDSLTDDLTGISNRRHILACLEERLNSDQPGGAFLFDLDHFKLINDSYGHRMGDKVLIQLAHTVRKTLRLTTPFGRIGGEEFLILLDGPAMEQPDPTLRKIHNAIAALGPFQGGPTRPITISGGLAAFFPSDTVSAVLTRADEALYQAKSGGRSRSKILETDSFVLWPDRDERVAAG